MNLNHRDNEETSAHVRCNRAVKTSAWAWKLLWGGRDRGLLPECLLELITGEQSKAHQRCREATKALPQTQGTFKASRKLTKLKPVQQKKSKPKKGRKRPIMGQHKSTLERRDVRTHHTKPSLGRTLSTSRQRLAWEPTEKDILSIPLQSSPPFLHFQGNHTQCLCVFSPRLSQVENKTGCWSALRWGNSGRLLVSILTTHSLGACTPGFSGCRHSCSCGQTLVNG